MHWIYHFLKIGHLRGEVEVEIYETKSEAYLLRMGNGLSIEKEGGNGLSDLLEYRMGRKVYVMLSGLTAGVYVLHLLNECGVLRRVGLMEPALYELPETWSGVFFQTPSLILGGLTVVLGPPALWFYAKHRKALRSIKEMYREEGVIE